MTRKRTDSFGNPLVHLLEETTGRFRGVRHEQLAQELGWGKRQRVSERYGEAIQAGLLKRSNGGYNGCPTVYDAKPPPDEGTQPLGTFRPVTVPSHGEPSEPTKVPSHRVRFPRDRGGVSYTNEIARRLTSGDSGDVRQLWVAEEASNEMRQAL